VNKFKWIMFSLTSSYFLSTATFAAGAAPATAAGATVPAGAAASTVAKSVAVKAQTNAQTSGPDGTLAAPGVESAPAVPAEDPTVYGMAMSGVLVYDNPDRAHTYRGLFWYQPPKWRWNRLEVHVSGSFGHWWSDGAPIYRALNIYAVAPVLRYYFVKMKYFSPYLEASVGPGYLSRTHFANRNLGMHFTFQDELGIGLVAGREAGFYATASIIHYSNAHMSAHNSGITVPLLLTVGYQFN
jgi:hypothetical protein